ncbi:hypothetical protein [Gimesia maris]|uniref:hypothetical protein n=1 Tax=Gimesia maris TaxID=122 RepID=UPI0018AFF350|nr:hypothetical protein [Gimesia maris]
MVPWAIDTPVIAGWLAQWAYLYAKPVALGLSGAFSVNRGSNGFGNNFNYASSEGHYAEWELRDPSGKLIARDIETSGTDFSNPGKLTFPEQSWYAHTEGKIISDLYDSNLLQPGRFLNIDGILAPCSHCRGIMRWASQKFNMTIQYLGENGATIYKNGKIHDPNIPF